MGTVRVGSSTRCLDAVAFATPETRGRGSLGPTQVGRFFPVRRMAARIGGK